MNKYQFAAIFFSISLLRDGLDQYIEIAFVICAVVSFLLGLKEE